MSGELYRAKMRFIHRIGLCAPEPVAVEEGRVWCHWCGMRGSKVTPAMLQRAEAELIARCTSPTEDEGSVAT